MINMYLNKVWAGRVARFGRIDVGSTEAGSAQVL
jgi:hypothetical protein